MQKKIIALAVVAAAFSAPAFADATLYGVVDAAVAKVSADGVKGDILPVSGGLSSSRIGVKSVEDLNNGMKAVAVLEYGLDGENGSGIGAPRQTMLAVASDYGTVATGYLQTAAYDQAGMFDPAAGSAVSALQAVTSVSGFLNGSKAGASRAPRALAYISPNLGGVTLAWNWSSDLSGSLGNADNAGDTKTSGYLLSAAYAAGPLAAGFVYTGVTAAGSSAMTEWSAGASYDLGMAKIMGTYQSHTTKNVGAAAAIPAAGAYYTPGVFDPTTGTTGAAVLHPATAAVAAVAGTDTTDKAYSISAVAPVGPGAVALSYAANKMDSGAKGSAITVAYLQGMSKTVTAYAALEHASNTGAAGVSVDNGVYGAGMSGASTLIAVGLNKKF